MDTPPAVIPPGGSFFIFVAFQPAASGPRFGSQTILNNVGLANSVITFSGNGASPIPMLDGLALFLLAAGLALAAVSLIFRRGFHPP
jgi:hypothetical protein